MRFRLLIFSIFCAFHCFSQNWMQVAGFPQEGRDDGCSFTIDGVAYCGTGRNAWFQVTSNFFAFDFATEQWAPIASLPDTAMRQYATAEAYEGKGYVFGGIDAQGTYLNDLWSYDPFADLWIFLGNAPFSGRSGMQSFVIDDKLFIVGGRTANTAATDEMWSYDFTSAVWSSEDPYPYGGIWRGFAVNYLNTGIVGFGANELGKKSGRVYLYSPSIGGWTYVSAWDTIPVTYPAVQFIGDRMYVYGGEDTNGVFLNDFRYLDQVSFQWESANNFTSDARRGSMVFASASSFYITTGLTATERTNETWVARNVLSLYENTSSTPKISIVNSALKVNNGMNNLQMIDCLGKQVRLTQSDENTFRFPEDLPAGMYIVTGEYNGLLHRQKLLLSD